MAVGLLGSASPASGAITTLYTCPASYKAVVNFTATNTSSTSTTIRVYVKSSAAAPAITDAVFYNVTLPANGVPMNWTGITLTAGNTISVYHTGSGINFQVTGVEAGL